MNCEKRTKHSMYTKTVRNSQTSNNGRKGFCGSLYRLICKMCGRYWITNAKLLASLKYLSVITENMISIDHCTI